MKHRKSLRGQRNFRHHNYNCLIICKNSIYKLQIDRRFAASGNAVKKCSSAGTAFVIFEQTVIGFLLLVGEMYLSVVICALHGISADETPKLFAFKAFNNALLFERRYD